jgi:hypothetical protein
VRVRVRTTMTQSGEATGDVTSAEILEAVSLSPVELIRVRRSVEASSPLANTRRGAASIHQKWSAPWAVSSTRSTWTNVTSPTAPD